MAAQSSPTINGLNEGANIADSGEASHLPLVQLVDDTTYAMRRFLDPEFTDGAPVVFGDYLHLPQQQGDEAPGTMCEPENSNVVRPRRPKHREISSARALARARMRNILKELDKTLPRSQQ